MIIRTAAALNGVYPYATLPSFWKHYWELPNDARRQAVKSYIHWCMNPNHPGLAAKRLDEAYKLIYTVRAGISHRSAAYVMPGGIYFWFYVGPREDFDKMISNAKGGNIRTWWQNYKDEAFDAQGKPRPDSKYNIIPSRQMLEEAKKPKPIL